MQILNKMKLHAVIKLNLSTNLYPQNETTQSHKALDIFYYKAHNTLQKLTKINLLIVNFQKVNYYF